MNQKKRKLRVKMIKKRRKRRRKEEKKKSKMRKICSFNKIKARLWHFHHLR
jgi:hypothetical protein